MNDRTDSDDTDPLAAIERDASDWLAAHSLGVLDGYGRRAFRVWLAQDPRHAEVYERMAAAWDDEAVTRALREIDDEEKRTAQGGMLTAVARRLQSRRGGMLIRFALAATVLLAIVAGSYFRPHPRSSAAHDYATAPARISELKLADGSIVNLGAESRINVQFSSDRRDVALLAGEAFFAVTPDPNRPFVVSAGDTRVEVRGTRFEVSLAPAGVRVSVAEGVVELVRPAANHSARGASPQAPAEIRTTLHRGEQLVAGPESAIAVVAPVDPEVPGAWRDGRLIYRDARLDEVIADAQRYYAGRIELASPELGALRVTATFGSDDIKTMIRLLGEQAPLRIEWRTNGDIVLLAALAR